MLIALTYVNASNIEQEGAQHMKRKSLTSRILLWSFVVVCLVATGGGIALNRDKFLAFLPHQNGAEIEQLDRPAQPVRVSKVAYTQAQSQVVYTGTIRPRHEAKLGFRVSGKLLARLVSVGDRVEVGQTLARLDDADVRLELQSTEAELVAAQTELKRAEAEVQRSRKLAAQGFASRAAFDRAAATAAEAQGRVERASRARDLAANRLAYVELKADAGGVVTAELAEAGQVVQAGQGVVSIARTDAMDVVFALPEQSRDKLSDARATAQIWDRVTPRYELSLRDVAPDVDPATRTYRVRMAILAPDQHVTLGRTATVTLTASAHKPLATLPIASVLNDGSGAAVWRLMPDGRKVERVTVKLEAVDDRVAKISGGVMEGDRVVSLGAYKIDPTRPVKVVETTTATLD
jgi:RND family efflux transporter MFP subunit